MLKSEFLTQVLPSLLYTMKSQTILQEIDLGAVTSAFEVSITVSHHIWGKTLMVRNCTHCIATKQLNVPLSLGFFGHFLSPIPLHFS